MVVAARVLYIDLMRVRDSILGSQQHINSQFSMGKMVGKMLVDMKFEYTFGSVSTSSFDLNPWYTGLASAAEISRA